MTVKVDTRPKPEPEVERRQAALAAHPHYHLSFEPSEKRVKVVFNEVVIAKSDRAMVMRETRNPPVYYLPREDVRMDLLERTGHHTYCPFKGTASYWTLKVGDKTAENAVWSYEEPFEEVAQIKDYLAFYWNKVDAWYEADKELAIDAGALTHSHSNRFVDWLLREAWEASSTEELVLRLARCLEEQGVPLMRLALVIRTLHPQLLGRGYVWQRDQSVVEPRSLSYSVLDNPAFVSSPLVPVFQGAGGIRRHLSAPDAKLDFPILEELRDQGATDYVAMPLMFSDGEIHALTLATDRAGGFTTDELGQIYEILPILSRLLEVQAMRTTARTLLDTYLGPHTGEQVMNGQIKRGDGETIPAVIWYCDLRGSTKMAESLPLETYLNTLNDFFECTAGAVLEHGGEVLKFIGDAVLAIFPIAVERGTDAEAYRHRKCLAAAAACEQALQATRQAFGALDRLNRDRATRDEPALRFALALHLGEVAYGNVGVARRLDFTVIGPAANETARLADVCKTLEHSVVISDSFASKLEESFVSLGHHSLRGVGASHEVFTLPPMADDAQEGEAVAGDGPKDDGEAQASA